MTQKQKAAKFDKIQKLLWDMAMHGNLLQSTMAAALIRKLKTPGSDGSDPNDA